ncbi:MAG TPA: ABC transporter permease, partial [Nitrospira sp.]|nr:ABC transporter permease [Nitrospira sp.]
TLDEWHSGVKAAANNRLITVHAMSDSLLLPLSYRDRMSVVPGVQVVHFGNVFGVEYRDAKESFGAFAEQMSTFFETYPEVILNEGDRLAFLKDRGGCLIGQKLAARFGWKVGDVIPLKGTTHPGNWDLVVRGIFRSSSPGIMGEGELYVHWEFANERLRSTAPDRADQVGWYVITTAPGVNPRTVVAAIDATFANSFAETRSEREQAYIAGWVARSGALLDALDWLSGVMNGIAALVLVNALAMAVRERTREYGVMKTLGFQPRHLVALVLGESLLVALGGALAGLGLLYPAARLYAVMVAGGKTVGAYEITFETIGMCLGVMGLVGLMAALWPAVRLSRMTTLEGLRHRG